MRLFLCRLTRGTDRKSTRLNSSHTVISYAVFCLKKKNAAAASGAEAIERLREGAPDLVVLGRSLPDMDGLDLLPRLKGAHDQFTPVLIASHRSATAERVLGLQMGADDYLALPCDPDELLARVRALLRVKEMHDRVLSIQRELERLVGSP